jgi:hypothetical protein
MMAMTLTQRKSKRVHRPPLPFDLLGTAYIRRKRARDNAAAAAVQEQRTNVGPTEGNSEEEDATCPRWCRPDGVGAEVLGGMTTTEVQNMVAAKKAWDTIEAALIKGMACCAVCGRAAMGGPHSKYKRSTTELKPEEDGSVVAPAHQSNPIMAALYTNARGKLHACEACQRDPERRARMARMWPTATEDMVLDMVDVVNLPPGAALELSIMRTPVRLADRYKGFLHASCVADMDPAVVGGPLVNWLTSDEAHGAADTLVDVLERQRERGNPLYTQYQTMLEVTATAQDGGGPSTGVPILGRDSITPILDACQGRDVTAGTLDATQNKCSLMAATDAHNVLEQPELEAIHKMPRGNAAYFAGSTLTRAGFEERHMSLATGVGLHPLVTVESGLFPYLFEHGVGFYQGPERLDHYLGMRMNALFTPFTLVREYVLIMAQILMATQLLNNVKARALEKAHEQELLARPNDTARVDGNAWQSASFQAKWWGPPHTTSASCRTCSRRLRTRASPPYFGRPPLMRCVSSLLRHDA